MSPIKSTKSIVLLGAFVCAAIGLASSNISQAVGPDRATLAQASANLQDAGYVGSEVCKDCHEDQFKSFSHTSHSELVRISGWRNKVTGCESCHGPGKAHIEEGDPKAIISFKNKTSKEASETCLTCHAGKEEHNNFRRGEHWRNDIGCNDCHSSLFIVNTRQLSEDD